MVVCGASSPGSMPRKEASDLHDNEDIIQEGCRILASQQKPQYMDVCQWLKEHHGIDISYCTLCNRFLGKTVPC